jgi:hypothetical protein
MNIMSALSFQSNIKMIIEKQIKQLTQWLENGYVYEDANGSGFYVNIDAKIGGEKFVAIPKKFIGIFFPVEFDSKFCVGVCSGIAFTKRKISEERAKQICRFYRLKKMQLYKLEFHDDSLKSAISFASLHHRHQLRKADDTAYITHLIEVAILVEKIGNVSDADTLRAAILHDIVEDTHLAIESIQLLFGKKVAHIVGELTSTKTASTLEKRLDIIEKLGTASSKAKLIKLADLASNVALIPNWPDERVKEYIDWCMTVGTICKPVSKALFEYFASHCEVIYQNKFRD